MHLKNDEKMNKNLNKFVHSFFDILLLILNDQENSKKFQETVKKLFFGLLDSRAIKSGLISFGTLYKIYPKRIFYIEKEDKMRVKLENILKHENLHFFTKNVHTVVDFMIGCYTLRIKESFKEITVQSRKRYKDLMAQIFDKIAEKYEINNDFSSHDLLLSLVMIASFSDKFKVNISADNFDMDRNKFIRSYIDKKIICIRALPFTKK